MQTYLHLWITPSRRNRESGENLATESLHLFEMGDIMIIPEFVSPTASFIEDIERLVKEDNLNHLDAIIHWSESKNIDLDYVATLVSKNSTLKSKLRSEAETLNHIPKSKRLQI